LLLNATTYFSVYSKVDW